MSIKHLINPAAAAKLQRERALGFVTDLLTCKVYAHTDGEQQIVVTASKDLQVGDVIAIIPRMGDIDAERILAGNIAWAMNKERGHE